MKNNMFYLSITLLLLSIHRNHAKQRSHGEMRDTIRLPAPRSDLTATNAFAPNEEGDLTAAIYLMGGCEHYKPNGEEYCAQVTNNTWSYEPYENIFVERSHMPRSRYRHIAKTIDGKIWVLGGRDQNARLISEIDIYDPTHDKWTILDTEDTRLPPNLLSR